MMRIGIAKGRGFAECAALLQDGGVDLPADFLRERLTVAEAARTHVFAVRGCDLPWLLEAQHIDIAVGSSIWFDEYGCQSVLEAQPLDVSCCRLSLIAPPGSAVRRICTRFPSLARALIAERYRDAEIAYMAGSNEVSIVLGIADAIIDVVETGWTLHRFGLTELEVLRGVRHGFWTRRDDQRAASLVSQFIPAQVRL